MFLSYTYYKKTIFKLNITIFFKSAQYTYILRVLKETNDFLHKEF